jgi:hypothetical protein
MDSTHSFQPQSHSSDPNPNDLQAHTAKLPGTSSSENQGSDLIDLRDFKFNVSKGSMLKAKSTYDFEEEKETRSPIIHTDQNILVKQEPVYDARHDEISSRELNFEDNEEEDEAEDEKVISQFISQGNLSSVGGFQSGSNKDGQSKGSPFRISGSLHKGVSKSERQSQNNQKSPSQVERVT